MTAPEGNAPGVIAWPPLIYLAALGAGLGLDYLWPMSVVPAGVRYPLGLSLIAISGLVMPFVLRQFRKARTRFFDTRKPATALVTGGPLRFSRNPGYVSLSLVYLGIGIATDNAWVLALLVPVVAVMHYGVILREERHLEERFGEDYVRYKASVRRWL